MRLSKEVLARSDLHFRNSSLDEDILLKAGGWLKNTQFLKAKVLYTYSKKTLIDGTDFAARALE